MLIAQCNGYRLMTPSAFTLVLYKPHFHYPVEATGMIAYSMVTTSRRLVCFCAEEHLGDHWKKILNGTVIQTDVWDHTDRQTEQQPTVRGVFSSGMKAVKGPLWLSSSGHPFSETHRHTHIHTKGQRSQQRYSISTTSWKCPLFYNNVKKTPFYGISG